MQKNKFIASAFGLSFLFILISAVLIFYRVVHLSGGLILHFDTLTGRIVLGDRLDLAEIVATSGFISLLNFWLTKAVYRSQIFLAYFLASGSCLAAFLLVVFSFSFLAVN